MLTWVGFLTLVVLGCYCLYGALSWTLLTLGFTGKWSPWILVPVLGGVALLYVAYLNAPFALVPR